MSTQTTSKFDVMVMESEITALIKKYNIKLSYRRRASVLTLFDGDPPMRQDIIRFSRCTKQYWIAEVKSGSNWEGLPFRGPLKDVFTEVYENFPWYLALDS